MNQEVTQFSCDYMATDRQIISCRGYALKPRRSQYAMMPLYKSYMNQMLCMTSTKRTLIFKIK